MTEKQDNLRQWDPARAYEEGRRSALGAAALAVALVSGISMLGVEKAVMAIVLGVLAARGAAKGTRARRLGSVAVGIGVLFIVTVAVVLVVFWDKLNVLVRQLQQLS